MSITLRSRKFVVNSLLSRKQFVLDVLHPGVANVSKTELRSKLASMYNVNDIRTIFVFGLRTIHGGGKSTGFCVIYDVVNAAKSVEPRHRLVGNGLETKVSRFRKQMKERRNRNKTTRGRS